MAINPTEAIYRLSHKTKAAHLTHVRLTSKRLFLLIFFWSTLAIARLPATHRVDGLDLWNLRVRTANHKPLQFMLT